jgi:signal transduction histidine kinase
VKGVELGTVYIEIKVQDKGIGIEKADVEKIFSPFYKTKSEESRSANPSGTGLGLSISKSIALGLQGDLTVKSEVKKGSTFTFSLKAQIVMNYP